MGAGSVFAVTAGADFEREGISVHGANVEVFDNLRVSISKQRDGRDSWL